MSDTMWYVAVDGQTVGPMSEAELVDALQAGSYCPRHHGLLRGDHRVGACATPCPPSRATLPPPAPPGRRTGAADEVDYQIFGEEMQFVEIELDPGESVVAEAGAMMYMDDGINMETIFGDGRTSRAA